MKSGVEINGMRYVGVKTAADWWDLKPATVTKYCREGKIIGVYKDIHRHWMIPTNAEKPLHKETIKKVLRLVNTLKHNETIPIDYEALGVSVDNIPSAFKHLIKFGFVQPLSENVPAERILYEAKLTNKGLDEIRTASLKTKSLTSEEIKITIIKALIPALIELSAKAVQVFLYEK